MHRFEVFLVALDPTVGREIKKTRPSVIVSSDEINDHLGTVLVAPMTTKGKPYPSRVKCVFQKKNGLVVLDQLRAVDKRRLVKQLGQLDAETSKAISARLIEMFTF